MSSSANARFVQTECRYPRFLGVDLDVYFKRQGVRYRAAFRINGSLAFNSHHISITSVVRLQLWDNIQRLYSTAHRA
jgi:hypothetical protein